MTDNWIERKARVERASREGARKVWLDAVAALKDCHASFAQHYPDPVSIEIEQQNGHRLLITVFHKKTLPGTRGTLEKVGFIDVTFDANAPRIVVTHNEKVSRFPISSDEKDAFLTHKNEPLESDAFTKLVLENVLFPRQQHSD